MIYIYLTVGCWLKYIYPEFAGITDATWQICAWLFTASCLFIAGVWLFTKQKPNTPPTSWTHMGAVFMAGLLSGHPFSTLAMVVSYLALSVVEGYKNSTGK